MEAEIHLEVGLNIAVPLVLACLVGASYLAAAETAITGASRPRMHRLAQQGKRRAVLVNRLLERKDEVVSATLIGNSILNIFSASLTTAVLTDLFGGAGVVYATLALTVFVVLFVEVLPKTWAIIQADRLALALAPTLNVVMLVLGPVASASTRGARGFLNLIGVHGHAAAQEAEAQTEALRGAIELHGEGGHADGAAPAEKAMLRSVLDLGDLTVGDVMTHRGNVVLVDADLPVDEIVNQMLASVYTRVPAYRGQPDNVVGVIHAKDLFRAVRAAGGSDNVGIDAAMTPPWFIPETSTLFDQLEAFRERHEHFAIVVDEYGALRGIVTLEDIIEEIVGEIEDEHDVDAAPEFKRRTDGSLDADARAEIEALEKIIGSFATEEERDEFLSLGGLVFALADRVPNRGEIVAHPAGLEFEILDSDPRRVKRLRIRDRRPVAAPAAADTQG